MHPRRALHQSKSHPVTEVWDHETLTSHPDQYVKPLGQPPRPISQSLRLQLPCQVVYLLPGWWDDQPLQDELLLPLIVSYTRHSVPVITLGVSMLEVAASSVTAFDLHIMGHGCARQPELICIHNSEDS